MLASGFPARQGALAGVIERWLRREFQLVLFDHIIDGVKRDREIPYFRLRYPREEAQRSLSLLRHRATLVVPAPAVRGVADDEADDLVLATAGAAYLVTDDKGLLAIGKFRGVEMLSPQQFLDLLEAAQGEAP